MLEDFVRTLIPSGDSLLVKAEGIVDEIEREGLRNYPALHRRKAIIHTWLAWQEIPGQTMGLAITTQALQHDTPAALAFVAWLRHLFDLDAAPEVA